MIDKLPGVIEVSDSWFQVPDLLLPIMPSKRLSQFSVKHARWSFRASADLCKVAEGLLPIYLPAGASEYEVLAYMHLQAQKYQGFFSLGIKSDCLYLLYAPGI